MCKYKTFLVLLILPFVLLTACSKGYKPIRIHEPLDRIATANGKAFDITTGVGSGAFHQRGDPDHIIYTITDRGPNMWSDVLPALFAINAPAEPGLLMLVPAFTPAIYKIAVQKKGYRVLERILIKDKTGLPVTGIPNPETERAYDIAGRKIPHDPDGLDTEAIVRLMDGSFWVADEYAPSLVSLSPQGQIRERIRPSGGLPQILRKRTSNRGIEALAVSPDECCLYFMTQSPLAHPDQDTVTLSRNVRLYRFNLNSKRIDREYLYRMADARDFKKDYLDKDTPPPQKDVKISEMVSVGQGTLVVLERVENSTSLYRVELNDAQSILDTAWDAEDTSPSLEQLDQRQIREAGLKPLDKTPVFDSDDFKNFPPKIEGLAHIRGDRWVLINDSDFGIDGRDSYLIKVNIPE